MPPTTRNQEPPADGMRRPASRTHHLQETQSSAARNNALRPNTTGVQGPTRTTHGPLTRRPIARSRNTRANPENQVHEDIEDENDGMMSTNNRPAVTNAAPAAPAAPATTATTNTRGRGADRVSRARRTRNTTTETNVEPDDDDAQHNTNTNNNKKKTGELAIRDKDGHFVPIMPMPGCGERDYEAEEEAAIKAENDRLTANCRAFWAEGGAPGDSAESKAIEARYEQSAKDIMHRLRIDTAKILREEAWKYEPQNDPLAQAFNRSFPRK